MPHVFRGLDELRAGVGTTFGPSDWVEIDQHRIDTFAEATGDDQWIHVNPARAAAESPYGGTIAHGYLTLSLTNMLLPTIVEVQGVSMGINYGAARVRFPAPVPVGSRVRLVGELTAADEVKGGVQTTMTLTVEIEGADKPGCVVESLSRWIA